MQRDVRERLKNIATHGGKYFRGTAKLFLGTAKETIIGENLPAFVSFADTNRELAEDTVNFLRNPVDTISKSVSVALESKDFQALKKITQYALEDLKSGNFYDAARDRVNGLGDFGFDDNFGSDDDLFGGFDMSGFDEDGNWEEPEDTDTSSSNVDVKIAKAQEAGADNRTGATIGAIGTAADAIVQNENANAQTNIRLSLRQHSQLMNIATNMVTYQGAAVQTIDAFAKSMLEVTRESHQQTMTQLQAINETLNKIALNTAPPAVQKKAEPPKSVMDNIFGMDGALNIKEYAKYIVKNVDEKFSISDMVSMATMGGGIAGTLELYSDNPLMLLSDTLLKALIPKSSMDQLRRTNAYAENFFPALLNKFADRGRRAESGESTSILDMILGIFGVTERSRSGIDITGRNLSEQAAFTNRTAKAVEQVIPMWLSRIYSAISGDPLQIFDYGTGRFARVTEVIGRETHNAYDLAGRMGEGYAEMERRASSMHFMNADMDRDFRDYLYQWMQHQAERNIFVNPFKDEKDFLLDAPDTSENVELDRLMTGATNRKELYNTVIQGMLRAMVEDDKASDNSRAKILAMGADINRARAARSRANVDLNNQLYESGLQMAFSGVLDRDLQYHLERAARTSRNGVLPADEERLVEQNNRARGFGISSLANAGSDIVSILKRGIITYTYIMGGSVGGAGDSPVLDSARQKLFDEVSSDSISESNRIVRMQTRTLENKQRQEEAKKKDEETRKQRKLVKEGNYTGDFENFIIDANTSAAQIYAQQRAYGETTRVENESKLVEEGKAFIDKTRSNVEQKTGIGAKFAKIRDTITKTPFELVETGLRAVDSVMFRIIYGKDAAELMKKEGEDLPSLFRTMEATVRAKWEDAKNWFNEHIGGPLKEYLFGDQGLFTRLRDRFDKDIITPIRSKITEIAGRVRDRTLGTKVMDEEGKYTGHRQGGIFSDIYNRVSDNVRGATGTIGDRIFGKKNEDGTRTPGIIDEFLYGDASGETRRGVRVKADGTTEYRGLFGKIKQGIDSFSELMFGKEDEDDVNGSRKKRDFILSELNKAAPDMLIGAAGITALNAGFGLLTGMALPGGPLVAPLLGAGIGLLRSSESFQQFLFGEQERDENGNLKYDSNGNPIYKEGKGPRISPEVVAGFKKYFPKVAGGFALGAIGSGLLPFAVSPMVGGLIGSMGGMIAGSDAMKEALFGTKDDPDSGAISKNMREKIADFVKVRGGGAIGGFALSKLILGLGTGIGIIPGGLAAVLGPAFAALSTTLGAAFGPDIKKALFGDEVEVEETSTDKDGKTVTTKKKKRQGGLFGSIFDFTRDKIMDPAAKQVDRLGKNIASWFKVNVEGPFVRGMQPLHDAFGRAGAAVNKFFENIATSIKDSLDKVFEKNVGKPLGDFFKENVIDKLGGLVNRLFNSIGRMIGSILSAPFKVLEFAFAGTIDGKSPEEYNSEKDREREEKRRERREKNRDRRMNRAAQSWKRLFGGASVKTATPETTVGEEMSSSTSGETPDAEVTEAAKDAKKKRGFLYRLLHLGREDIPAQPYDYSVLYKDQKTKDDQNAPSMGIDTETERKPSAEEEKISSTEPTEETSVSKTSGTDDERERLRRSQEAKEESKTSTNTAAESVTEEPKPTAESSDRSGSRRIGKRKTDNAYLGDIASYTKVLPKIFDEIRGQLGGTGWNLAYIKTLLAKQYGGLSAEELPEEMEGSKKVRKKRGIFGKIKDKVTDTVGGFVGGIKNRITGAASAVGGVVDAVIGAPFRFIKGTIGAVGNALGLLKDTILGAVKTFGNVVGNIFVGAAKGIGSALHGFGKMLLAAGPGIGAAFGNIASTVTGAAKDLGHVFGGLIRGLVDTVAAIAPEIALGLWDSLKFLGKTAFGSVKLAANAIGSGVSWAFGKVGNLLGFGGSKEERVIKKVKKIGAITMNGGYLDSIKEPVPIGVADRAGIVDDFPLVDVVKGVARKFGAGKSKAIPVYILGISRDSVIRTEDDDNAPGTNTDTGNGNEKAPGATGSTEPIAEGTSETGSEGNASMGIDSANPKSPFGKIADKARDLKKAAAAKLREWKRKYMEVDKEAETSLDPNETYDRAIESSKSDTEVEATLASQQNNSKGGQVESKDEKDTEEEEKGGFFETIKSFFTEGGIGGAIKTVLDLGGGAVLPAALTAIFGAKSIAEGDGSGMARTAENVLQQIVRKLGLGKTKAGDLLSSFIDPSKADDVAKSLADVAADPETGKKAAKAATRGSKFVKAASKAGNAVATAAGKIGSIVKGAATKVFNAILNNKVVQAIAGTKLVGKLRSAASKVVSVIADSAVTRGLKSMGTSAASSIARTLGAYGTGGLLTIGFAIADFYTGMNEAYKAFGVSASDATLGMKVATGVTRAVTGALSVIPPPVGTVLSIGLSFVESQIAQILYSALADEDAMEEWQQNQQELQAATDAYNATNGADLTTEEYAKQFNNDGTERKGLLKTVGSAIAGGVKKVGSTIASGASKVGDFVGNVASSAWNKITGFASGVKDFASNIPENVGELWSNAVKSAGGIAFNIVDFATNKLPEFGGKILDTVKSIPSKLLDGFTSIKDLVLQGFDMAKNALVNFVTKDAPNAVSGAVSTVADFFASIPSRVSDMFSAAGNALLDVGKYAVKIVSTVGTFLTKTLPNAIWNVLTSAATTAVNGLKEAWEGVTGVGGAILSGIKGIFGAIGDFFSGTVEDFKEGYNERKNEVYSERYDADWETSFGKGPMKHYRQGDPRWNTPVNGLDTDGCGPTAAAMVATAYGKGPSNPMEADTMSRQMGMRAADGGTNPAFFQQYANAKGFNMQQGPTDAASIQSNLKNNQPVVFMGQGGAFGGNVHYLVADKMTGKDQVSVTDPITGGSRSVTMQNLVKNTKDTIYSSKTTVGDLQSSYGKGAMNFGADKEDEESKKYTGVPSGKSSTKEAQQALVDRMASIVGQLTYDSGGPNNPDQGSASCASTVGWVYKKTLGIDGMSIRSREQVNDPHFTTIWRNDGNDVLDPNILQPGDILYSNMSENKNLGYIGHTEMYAGTDANGTPMDLSHGGPGAGPQWKTLNQYRKERTIAVNRYTPFLEGQSVDVSTDGADITPTSAATSSSTIGENPTDTTMETDSTTTSSSGSSNVFTAGIDSLLSSIGSVITSGGTKLGNVLTALMGGTIAGGSSDSSSDSSGITRVNLNEDGSSSSTGSTSGTSNVDFGSASNVKQYDQTESTNIIYEYLRKMGLTPMGASGIMGCWDNESRNRSDIVEGYYMGSSNGYPGFNKVLESNATLNDYTKNVLFPYYRRQDIGYNESGYVASDKNYYPGLGLAQWTGERGMKLLQYATSTGQDWRNLETQLNFFKKEATDRGLVDMLNSAATPSLAAQVALDNYEMSPGWSSRPLGQKQLKARAASAESIYQTYAAQDKGASNTDDATVLANTAGGTTNLTSTNGGMTATGGASSAESFGTGAWGRGPGNDVGKSIADLSANTTSMLNRIQSITSNIRDTVNTVSNEESVSKLTSTLTKALNNAVGQVAGGGTASSTDYTQTLTVIATSLSTMIQLLTKIANNTSNGANNNTTAAINRKAPVGTGAPVYPNGIESPDDTGALTINRLTGI